MSKTGFEWQTDPESAFSAMYDASTWAIHDAVRDLANYFAPQIEADMRASALWTDRTGNARQALHAEVEDLIKQIVIALDHGVEYGYWLEFAHAGRFAIIAPTIDKWAPVIFEALRKLIRG